MMVRGYLLILLVPLAAWANSLSGYESEISRYDPDSNDIFSSVVRKRKEYPVCEGNSICAFLQANNKGLTKVRYCTCQNHLSCPLTWDPYDGQSVSQATSDQFKYCGSTPAMKQCLSTSQVAYTSYQTYEGDTKIQMRDEIHCVCPFGSTYQDVKFDFSEEGSREIVKISYYCMPLRQCNTTEFCKDITEKPGEYIVNPKCLCGGNMACPSVSDIRPPNKQIRMGDLTFTNIKCQEPYAEGMSAAEIFRLMKSKKNILQTLKDRRMDRHSNDNNNSRWKRR